MVAPGRPRMARGEVILLLALVGEVALFAVIALNFFTPGNFFEIVRLSVELACSRSHRRRSSSAAGSTSPSDR